MSIYDLLREDPETRQDPETLTDPRTLEERAPAATMGAGSRVVVAGRSELGSVRVMDHDAPERDPGVDGADDPPLTPSQQQTGRGNRDALSSLASTVGRRARKAAAQPGSRARSASQAAAERVQNATGRLDVEAASQAAGEQARTAGQAAGAAGQLAGAAAASAGQAAGVAAEKARRGAEQAGSRVRDRLAANTDLEPLGRQLLTLPGLIGLAPRPTRRASALLPGRVGGIELDEDQLTVRITAAYGARLPQLAAQVHEAARPYAGQRRTLVEVVALEQPVRGAEPPAPHDPQAHDPAPHDPNLPGGTP